MVCRRPPGRASAPCRSVQSRAPRSGLSPDYATLIRIAAPLHDASTTRGTEVASTLTLPPKRRGRESTGGCQVLRFAALLTGPEQHPRLALPDSQALSKPRIPTGPNVGSGHDGDSALPGAVTFLRDRNRPITGLIAQISKRVLTGDQVRGYERTGDSSSRVDAHDLGLHDHPKRCERIGHRAFQRYAEQTPKEWLAILSLPRDPRYPR